MPGPLDASEPHRPWCCSGPLNPPHLHDLHALPSPGGYIVDHLLTQHRLAFASIIKAQFGHAALKGGMQGVEALAKTLDLDAVLLAKNCDLESLRDPGSKPVPLEVAARMAQVTAGGAPRGGTRVRHSPRSTACTRLPTVKGRAPLK